MRSMPAFKRSLKTLFQTDSLPTVASSKDRTKLDNVMRHRSIVIGGALNQLLIWFDLNDCSQIRQRLRSSDALLVDVSTRSRLPIASVTSLVLHLILRVHLRRRHPPDRVTDVSDCASQHFGRYAMCGALRWCFSTPAYCVVACVVVIAVLLCSQPP